MTGRFTHVALREVEDSGPGLGLGGSQEARFATEALGAERTGVTLHRLAPGFRQPFGHRHDQAEEVYVVLAGSGRMKLDDEVVELDPLDAIRVAPEVTRAFEAGPEGLELLACGAQHGADGELVMDWWTG